jgi:hypothetical protein
MRSRNKWIIVLVAHNDPEIEAKVIKERIAVNENPQLAALLRGGELVAVLADDSEAVAEAERIDAEKWCLR